MRRRVSGCEHATDCAPRGRIGWDEKAAAAVSICDLPLLPPQGRMIGSELSPFPCAGIGESQEHHQVIAQSASGFSISDCRVSTGFVAFHPSIVLFMFLWCTSASFVVKKSHE